MRSALEPVHLNASTPRYRMVTSRFTSANADKLAFPTTGASCRAPHHRTVLKLQPTYDPHTRGGGGGATKIGKPACLSAWKTMTVVLLWCFSRRSETHKLLIWRFIADTRLDENNRRLARI